MLFYNSNEMYSFCYSSQIIQQALVLYTWLCFVLNSFAYNVQFNVFLEVIDMFLPVFNLYVIKQIDSCIMWEKVALDKSLHLWCLMI